MKPTPDTQYQDPILRSLLQPEAGLPAPTLAMHPRKFALWLFIVSIIMIFASMTSAYLVRKSEGNWMQFTLPPILFVSTAVLVVSSITVQLAYVAARRNAQTQLAILMSTTLALAFTFLYLQWESWVNLVDINVYLVGNPSGSFLYILTGLHALHLLTGIVYLSIVTIMVFRGKINRENSLDMELSATYWHFLDLLWVALFGFLLWSHGVL